MGPVCLLSQTGFKSQSAVNRRDRKWGAGQFFVPPCTAQISNSAPSSVSEWLTSLYVERGLMWVGSAHTWSPSSRRVNTADGRPLLWPHGVPRHYRLSTCMESVLCDRRILVGRICKHISSEASFAPLECTVLRGTFRKTLLESMHNVLLFLPPTANQFCILCWKSFYCWLTVIVINDTNLTLGNNSFREKWNLKTRISGEGAILKCLGGILCIKKFYTLAQTTYFLYLCCNLFILFWTGYLYWKGIFPFLSHPVC